VPGHPVGDPPVSKPPKLAVRDIGDVPLREVSGLARRGVQLMAGGDHDPALFTADLEQWPLQWRGTDLAGLGLPEGGIQFEAVLPVDDGVVLVLQEQPARILQLDPSGPTLAGTLMLEIPEGHPLHEAWVGDRSSRGESLVLAGNGHLLVIKEKDPAAILEFGPAGDTAAGWRRGGLTSSPPIGDATLTVLAIWLLSADLAALLPDISDATVGPDGRLYVLSDQGSAIARLPDVLEPDGGPVDAVAAWRIAGKPEHAEGLVILKDGTVLVGLDTKSPKRNLLRLDPLPMD
jgi:hypothetical protein